MKNVKYSEPKDFFSKETRKKFGLGEFNTEEENKKSKEQKIKENEQRIKENEEIRKIFKGK